MDFSNHGSSRTYYRPDIDGLRAIAILAVIGGHVSPSLFRGGFVGVDIFFVISGFLISRIVIGEKLENCFSAFEFYKRRIRRLFPALIVVLLAVAAYGWFFLIPDEFAALGWHIVAGAGFFSNLLSYLQVGYFDPPAATKPLLHLWSLGVEEQFYIIFPAILVLALRYSRGAALIALLVLTILSFGLNIALVKSHPSFTFYLPLARLWEFSIGGALAYMSLHRQQPGNQNIFVQNYFAAIGLLLVMAGVAFVNPKGFPGWWALLPTLGAAFLITAGPDAFVNRKILANRALVFIGLISYPLYLWYWPLLVAANRLFPNDQIMNRIGVVACSFVLAWLTYRFVERPLRSIPSSRNRNAIIALASSIGVIALIGWVAVAADGFLSRYPQAVRNILMPTYVYEGPDPATIKAAAEEKGPTIVLWGDSHVDHLFLGLRQLQRRRHFRMVSQSWDSCPPVENIPVSEEERCRHVSTTANETLTKLKPDTVIIGAYWPQYHHVKRIEESLEFLQKIGVPRVVVIGTIPTWRDGLPKMLYEAFANDPRHHVPKRMRSNIKFPQHFDDTLKAIATQYGAVFVSPSDVLCNEEGCLTRIGDNAGDILQIDMHHFSPAGSLYFVSHIESQIFAEPF